MSLFIRRILQTLVLIIIVPSALFRCVITDLWTTCVIAYGACGGVCTDEFVKVWTEDVPWSEFPNHTKE